MTKGGMQMKAATILFALLRSEVCDDALTEEVIHALTPDRLESVYMLAKDHDLAHIAGQALGKNKLLPKGDISDQFRRQAMLALMRCSWLENAFENICAALETAKIPFIPLKGAVLRGYYPESWMRTSCDIDILVKEDNLEAAVKTLEEKLKYTRGEKSPHDISMLSADGGVHLELHYTVVEENRAVNASAVLKGIWDVANPWKEDGARQVLSDEMLYFYHIAHMAKHVQEGGCGVRPFLDLWILNHRVVFDAEKRKALLEKGGLTAFARVAEELSEAWFSDKEAGETAEQFARFILFGGMYGSVENDVAIKQTQKGGKFGYAMSRFFPATEKMKFRYPILQRRPWLLPVYHAVRWTEVLRKGNGLQSLRELETNATMSEDAVKSTSELMKQLGLQDEKDE